VRNVSLSEQGQSLVQNSIAARQSWLEDIPNKLSPMQQKRVSEALEILISVNQIEPATEDG